MRTKYSTRYHNYTNLIKKKAILHRLPIIAFALKSQSGKYPALKYPFNHLIILQKLTNINIIFTQDRVRTH